MFEWFKCDDRNRKNATKVWSCIRTSEIFESIYQTPTDMPVGKHYFYAVITHTRKEEPRKGASTTGPVIEITVDKATPTVYNNIDYPKASVDLKVSKRLGEYAIMRLAFLVISKHG